MFDLQLRMVGKQVDFRPVSHIRCSCTHPFLAFRLHDAVPQMPGSVSHSGAFGNEWLPASPKQLVRYVNPRPFLGPGDSSHPHHHPLQPASPTPLVQGSRTGLRRKESLPGAPLPPTQALNQNFPYQLWGREVLTYLLTLLGHLNLPCSCIFQKYFITYVFKCLTIKNTTKLNFTPLAEAVKNKTTGPQWNRLC